MCYANRPNPEGVSCITTGKVAEDSHQVGHRFWVHNYGLHRIANFVLLPTCSISLLQVYTADAKLGFDDNASFRQKVNVLYMVEVFSCVNSRQSSTWRTPLSWTQGKWTPPATTSTMSSWTETSDAWYVFHHFFSCLVLNIACSRIFFTFTFIGVVSKCI